MRVLIVHDRDEMRRALQAILLEHGCPSPRLAACGAEALRLLVPDRGEDDVDVVVLDADLPDADGLEVCRRMRATSALKDVPVLLLTERPAGRAYEAVCAAGASDFVRKPLQAAELLGRLRAAGRLKQELDGCRRHERELVRLNGELERLSVRDELTGIANRRFFNLVLAQEWARAVREAAPLALVLLDLDEFKAYNDYYGHPEGDTCLRRVAAALSGFMKRPGDHVARYGGEEFVAVLPHTGAAGAVAVAEGLRRAVEALGVEHACSRGDGCVTISLGVAATVPDRRGSAAALVAAADSAMYEAKRAGGNRTRVAPGPGDPTPALPPGSHTRLGARTD